jgi:hypothetical protein
MAEFAGNTAPGLIDLSAMSLADMPQLDDEMLQITIDRLMQPCGGVNDDMPAVGGRARMWQNYETAD